MREEPVTEGGILPPAGLLPPMPVYVPPTPPSFRFEADLRRVSKEIQQISSHEEARIFGPSGLTSIRYVGPKGPPFAIGIPMSERGMLAGTSLLHNHPGGGPLSLIDQAENLDEREGDLAAAISLGLAEIMATGRRWGQDVVSRLTRPPGGWPPILSSQLEVYLAEADVHATTWATNYRAWIGSLPSEKRPRAWAEYRILIRWLRLEASAQRLGIPYDILLVP